MAHLIRNKYDVLEGNIYFWKISKLLPDGVKEAKRFFKVHSTTWVYLTFFCDGFLFIIPDSLCTDIDYLNRLFKIRVGIAGDDLKEISSSSASVLSQIMLISRSQIDSTLMTNKFLYLFIEIQRKDDDIQKMKMRK